MDTSEEYKNMCEEATEIQNRWAYHSNDFWAFKEPDAPAPFKSGFEYLAFDIKDKVWLPRQDQLQEMLLEEESIGVIHTEFNELCFGGHHYPEITHSYQDYILQLINYAEGGFEVLWLAFFMKKKYNKIWGLGEWRTIPHDS